MSKKNELAVVDEKVLAELRDSYPVEQGSSKIILPRLSMKSQDVTEGKGKAMKVIVEAGTFFTEKETEDIDEETGKKIWDKQEVGKEIEGIILFQRRQLKLYDESTEMYSSTPVFDNDDEIIPLFCDKKEIARGTAKELKAKYEYTDKDGKKRSKLEDNKILYIQYEGSPYQMNLRGSSMWSFSTYAKKILPPSVITKFGSEAKEKGQIEWNQMTFDVVRPLNSKEVGEVLAKVKEIKTIIGLEKSQYKKEETEDELEKF